MPVIEHILSRLDDVGRFDNEDPMFGGIARLAIEHGYDSLSPKQKKMLEPFLSVSCSGCTDPGDHHNGCEVELVNEALLDALIENTDWESLQCERCRDESFFYMNQWDRFSRD